MNTDNTIAKSAPRVTVRVASSEQEDRARRDRRDRRDQREEGAPALGRRASPISKADFTLATSEVKAVVTKRANAAKRLEEAATLAAKFAVFIDAQKHTAIRVNEDAKHVQFIPMAAILEVVELPRYDFEKQYTQLEDYPVKQAARMYLEATHIGRSPIAQKHLDYLCGNSFVDPVQITNFNEKESVMTVAAQKAAAAKKSAPAPKAPPTKVVAKGPAPKAPVAARATASPAAKAAIADALADAAKGKPLPKAGKSVAAAKFAGSATPKKVAAPAAAPAKSAKPAKSPPVVAQKVKVVAPGVKNTVRASDSTKYIIAEPDKARKGATADACAVAKKLGASFTRPQLQTALEKAGWDAKVAKIKIADCVYFKVFAEVK